MDQFYLLDYLKKNNPAWSEKIDLLKYELDQRLYYYGEHFKNPWETSLNHQSDISRRSKNILKNIYTYCSLSGTPKKGGKTIISNAYFSINQELRRLGFNVLRPLHDLKTDEPAAGNFKIAQEFLTINRIIKNGNFNELLAEDFFVKLDLFTQHLTAFYRTIDAAILIVPNDIAFFEQLNIQIFKKLSKPSIIFLHGLPGRYDICDNIKTDYLCVWGKKIKQHYCQTGFNSEQIIISGHPAYGLRPDKPLRNSFENILVLAKALNGAPLDHGTRVADRGSLIVYLTQIASSLKACGVKQVRLRVHPSDNINWYYKFIDHNFFKADQDPLPDSLKKSTLVIGPTSTVFLEALYYDVNYLVYEPLVQGRDISGYSLVPPFDDSNPQVPVAHDEKTLRQLLQDRAVVDASIFNDYIAPHFNPEVITQLI